MKPLTGYLDESTVSYDVHNLRTPAPDLSTDFRYPAIHDVLFARQVSLGIVLVRPKQKRPRMPDSVRKRGAVTSIPKMNPYCAPIQCVNFPKLSKVFIQTFNFCGIGRPGFHCIGICRCTSLPEPDA